METLFYIKIEKSQSDILDFLFLPFCNTPPHECSYNFLLLNFALHLLHGLGLTWRKGERKWCFFFKNIPYLTQELPQIAWEARLPLNPGSIFESQKDSRQAGLV